MRTIPTTPSADARKSIKAFFYDFCVFMEENYSAQPDQLMLDWNCVGATARFHSWHHTFEFQLWETSHGHLGIPDMTIIVSLFYTNGEMAPIVGQWLAETAKANGFRHIADPSARPTKPDDNILGYKCSCITL